MRVIESVNVIISTYENAQEIQELLDKEAKEAREAEEAGETEGGDDKPKEEKKEEVKFEKATMGELQVDPTKATVWFGSGLLVWAFTLTKFARIYADKFKKV